MFRGPSGTDAGYRYRRALRNEKSNKGHEAIESLRDLEHRFDRMALLTEALWTILRDKVGISEDELMAVAREIDLLDGSEDGKLRQAAMECPECQRVIAKRRTRCIYCNTEIRRPPFGSI